MKDEISTFELTSREKVTFLSELEKPIESYSEEHEAAIGEWAYLQATQEGRDYEFIEEIGTRLLALYDAFVSMQMELNIEPIYDLELARSFKRIMGMTHGGILSLQRLSKSPEFSVFADSINVLDSGQRKKLWKDLIALSKLTEQKAIAHWKQHSNVDENEKDVEIAVKHFFKIPLELRVFDELKFVKADKLPVLLDYAKRESYRDRGLYTTSEGERYLNPNKTDRGKIDRSKDLRILMEIAQRNGGYATEEFDITTYEKAKTHKVGALSGTLSLLSHIDTAKRKKASGSRNITNESVFRTIMQFLPEQHFLVNEVYKLPAEQFAVLNSFLAKEHGFELKPDTHGTIHKTLESGGGAYALFSNTHIRASRSTEDKKVHYASFGEAPNLAFEDAAKNPSDVEKLAFENTRDQKGSATTHIMRGGDIFTVPTNITEVVSENPKAKDYVNAVIQQRYPVVAGISGTSPRHFAVGEALGLLDTKEKQGKLLTACLGFMVPLGHHSVFEIVSSLKSFNIPYDHSLGLIQGLGNFLKKDNFSKEIESLKWVVPKEVAKKKKRLEKKLEKTKRSSRNRPYRGRNK